MSKADTRAVNARRTRPYIEDSYGIPTVDAGMLDRLDDAYEAKYGIRHGTPVWRVDPLRVFAWTDFPADATCWRFDPLHE